MAAHSTVSYVEPNINVGLFRQTSGDTENGYVSDIWHPTDGFDRAPRLEDYCIALNLEVEISSRDTQGKRDVLILQWSGDDEKKGVSFMGGTRIGGYEVNGTDRKARLNSRDYLTTYYADMYVGDLVDYGTTEMIGIKSVNIEYEKSCVPIISIKFTDVRGFSLFQPTELSRNNNYDGIRGLTKDNVAQSFFQCFFKMPLPKFTIYVKGYYGKPVAYVMMCDKFETNFNSETGDYDVNTRFVGYSYSFMTDISFDALLASPYSDFEGKQYWEDNVKSGRFFLWDKLHTKKMPMPTLYEIHSEFKKLMKTSESGMMETTLTSEEISHEEELQKLDDIKKKYQKWYQELFNLLKEKYGKRYCFDFRESQGDDSNWFRILVLTNNSTLNVSDLSEDYKQFSEDFKSTNNDLYATIEDFNASGLSYKSLQNVSKDFSTYTRVKLFRDCYVNRNTRKIEFGGFSNECKLNKTQIVNRLFYGENSDLDTLANKVSTEEINKYKSSLKDFTLSTIYGDGTNQYKDAFIIEVDYSDIERRIKILKADAEKSIEQKEYAKRRKEHNRLMMNRMNWYPSVENFMKVMMAHVETYMKMMYRVKEACAERTPSGMSVTIGADGNANDTNVNSKTLPPFPRITKEEMGEDGTTYKVDAWVGDFTDGKERFIEEELINGLFNAVDALIELDKENSESNGGYGSGENVEVPIIKHPLTSYDFYLTKTPYGSDSDISDNPNAFAGKVAMRMFNILSLNNFKKEYGDKWSFSNGEFLEKLGEIEANNFHDCVDITNKNTLKMLGAEGGESVITPEAIIECVKNGTPIVKGEEMPWQKNNKDNLFDKEFWLDAFKTSNSKVTTKLYPMQDMSYNAIDGTLKKFNKDGIDVNNHDIMVNWITISSDNAWKLLKAKDLNTYGNLYISDDYKKISNLLDSSCSLPNNSYKEIYDLIHDTSVFNKDEYKNMIYSEGVFRPKQDVLTLKKYCTGSTKISNNISALTIHYDENTRQLVCGGGKKVEYNFDSSKLDSYSTEAENQNVTSWFFTECRGYKYDGEKYELSMNSSLFSQKDYMKQIESEDWGYGRYSDKKMGFFLMSLDAIDYNAVAKELGDNKTFAYIPKLAVLQIGAALSTLKDINASFSNVSIFERKIPLPKTFHAIVKYLNNISFTTRVGYIRYFRDWVFKWNSEITNKFFNTKNFNVALLYSVGESSERALFREDSEHSSGLANMLMLPVVVTKGNVRHYSNIRNEELTFAESSAKSYLTGFLRELKKLYGIHDEKLEPVKLTKEPTKVTEDMKKELYRYMKLVYEKWVPATDMKEWEFESFFDGEDGKEKKLRSNNAGGHLFHFIDSFYNKIGEKLLINPKSLSEIIDNALNAKNANTMMLGFIADVLSKNKCMLLCLQNFQDLGEPEAMEMMFRPIPYNSIRDVNKHPDFVILYPYEPSKYLNVDNGEFVNDSFMLNDEFETPLAIKTRDYNDGKNCYRIPAFGVSYGKQYQSYFKKVNVGMVSPIATQQSIMAKHALLRASQDGATQTVAANDLYDIYSTQSYTCTVEMMGCAWVQPLMYFVLTNIPLFKGSYLIFKVTHKITPGNMITEFKGTRMANVSNKLVEEIFTDEDLELSDSEIDITARRNALANIDNDCPYKVYPLYESDDINISAADLQKGKELMDKIASIIYDSDCSNNGVKIAAAGIVGNMYCETKPKFDHTSVNGNDNGFIAGGLCQWNDGYYNLTNLLHNNTKDYGQKENKSGSKLNVADVKKELGKLGVDHQIRFIKSTINKVSIRGGKGTYSKDILSSCTSASDAAKSFEYNYERSNGETVGTRMKAATKFYNYYSSSSTKETIKQNNKDIYEGFLNAVKKSLASTNSNVQLTYDKYYKDNTSLKGIIQSDGKNEKLDLVFDIILNGYYEYVQQLRWVADGSEKDFNGKPICIEVSVSEKVDSKSRVITVVHKGKENDDSKKKFGNATSNFNESLLKSIYKKYKNASDEERKEIQQFDNFDIFTDIEVKSCDTLISETYSNNPRTIGYNMGSKDRQKELEKLGFSNSPTKSECDKKMTTITVDTINGNKKITILNNPQVISEVQAIFKEIAQSGFNVRNDDTGGYCYRPISDSPRKTLSLHSFGIAIDINWKDNPLERGKKPLNSGDSDVKIRTLNSPVVKAFQNHGWGWGGRYGDYMHFSRINGN